MGHFLIIFCNLECKSIIILLLLSKSNISLFDLNLTTITAQTIKNDHSQKDNSRYFANDTQKSYTLQMLTILLQLIDDPADKRKFEDLYSRYEWLMFVVARDILKDPYKAEDAVNDAFINIIKNFEKIGATDSPRTKRFVVVIVRNICFNMLKKDKRHPEILSDDISEKDRQTNTAEDEFFDSYSIEKLKEKIRMLPAKQRDALYLHVAENMNVNEIATMLGSSGETVKKRIQRARKKLRELMEESDE